MDVIVLCYLCVCTCLCLCVLESVLEEEADERESLRIVQIIDSILFINQYHLKSESVPSINLQLQS